MNLTLQFLEKSPFIFTGRNFTFGIYLSNFPKISPLLNDFWVRIKHDFKNLRKFELDGFFSNQVWNQLLIDILSQSKSSIALKTALIDDDDEDVDGEYIDVQGPNAPATFGWILKMKVIFVWKEFQEFQKIFGFSENWHWN